MCLLRFLSFHGLFNDGNVHFKILHLSCERTGRRKWPLQLRGNKAYSGLKENNCFNFSGIQGEGIRGWTKLYFLWACVHCSCRELLTLYVPDLHPTIYPCPVPQCLACMLLYTSPFPPLAPFHLTLCCQLAKIWHVLGLVWSYLYTNWSASSLCWLTRQLLPSGGDRLFQHRRCPLSNTNLHQSNTP